MFNFRSILGMYKWSIVRKTLNVCKFITLFDVNF